MSDSTQLPAEFMNALPQIVAQNPVPTAPISGYRLAKGTVSSDVTTTGTTFAGGTDILATAFEFSATGNNDYIFRVSAAGWYLSTTAAALALHLNLDGADNKIFAQTTSTTANAVYPLSAAAYISKPSTGEHSVNARLTVGAGTGTIPASSAGGYLPIIITLEVA